jgi:hypothetical protein
MIVGRIERLCELYRNKGFLQGREALSDEGLGTIGNRRCVSAVD